ncbi:MAG TPA: hypothetical protein VJN18_35835 [Polyangiaceae bacterium]|nr:hypothetical protein [Polyangiaceae bacterium]
MPAATNLGNAKKGLSGSITQLGGLDTIDEALAIEITFDKAAADGMASTATTDTLVWVNPYAYPVYLYSAYGVATGAGITADASNNATITFRTRDGVGGASAAALSITTDVAGGTWTQNVSKAITTQTKANLAVPVGGQITFSIAKGGTGVVVPISKFVIKAYKAES